MVEDAVMKMSDFVFAFPALLTAIMLTSTYGPGIVNAIIAIGVFNVPVIAKVTRATANGGTLILYGALATDPTVVPPFAVAASDCSSAIVGSPFGKKSVEKNTARLP